MREIYTLLTDEGTRYAAMHNEMSFFITPAYADIRHAAGAHGWDVRFARKNAATNILTVTTEALASAESSVARLEGGRTLCDEDALGVNQVYEFLHATVSPHQRDFKFLSDDLLQHWIDELGVRTKRMGEGWDTFAIVHDGALWNAVHRPSLGLRHPDMVLPGAPFAERIKPSKGDNILAGRYMRSFAHLGKLFGPDRMKPVDIVAKWAVVNYEKAAVTPSLLGRVAELLTLAGWQVSGQP